MVSKPLHGFINTFPEICYFVTHLLNLEGFLSILSIPAGLALLRIGSYISVRSIAAAVFKDFIFRRCHGGNLELSRLFVRPSTHHC